MYMALAIAAGAGLAFQAVINSRLRFALGSALWAALAQVFVGLAVIAVIILCAREPVPMRESLARGPWWIWTGGALGALYVVAAIVATPPLGAALMIASVVVGQMLASLAIDHFGFLGVEVQPLSPSRLVGATLLLTGLWLVRFR